MFKSKTGKVLLATLFVIALGVIGTFDVQDTERTDERIEAVRQKLSASATEQAAALESAVDIIEKRALAVPSYDPDQR